MRHPRPIRFPGHAIALAILALAGGCDDDCGCIDVCEPGRTSICPCAGGGSGVRTCLDDGTGWGPCEGCPPDADADAAEADAGDVDAAEADAVDVPDADAADPDATEADDLVWPPYQDAPHWQSPEWGYATGVAWADVSGDGVLDLVVSFGNDMWPGPIRVWVAEPDGSLPWDATWESTETAYHGHLAAGDVDGDGRTDVVVSVMLAPDGEGPGGVAFYRNTGGQLTSVPVWESEERFHSFSLALGDVDLDGDLDLAVAVGEPFFHDPGQNLLFLREGGAFAEPPAWRSEPVRHSMDVAFLDADGNGALDLAFANDLEAHTLYLNTGDGTAPGLPSTTPSWEATHGPFEGNSLDHGDVDGDGHTDLVFSDSNYWLGGRGTLSLYCGPAFTHCWESADPAGYQSAVALVDLDGDDDLDLAAGKWWDRVRFYRNEGGLETLPSDETAHQAVVEAFAFHDTDGAALDDLVFEAEGPLVPLPRPCHPRASDPPGTWTDGWLVVPGGGTVQVTCGVSPALDLLVTDWDEDEGSALYIHR